MEKLKKVEDPKIRKFKDGLWAAMGRKFGKYPKAVVLAFVDYWTEKSPNARKMRFERQKNFDYVKRLGRFCYNAKKWHPELFSKSMKTGYVLPRQKGPTAPPPPRALCDKYIAQMKANLDKPQPPAPKPAQERMRKSNEGFNRYFREYLSNRNAD